MQEILNNIDAAIHSANDTSIATQILDLREEKERISIELELLEGKLLESMRSSNIKSIKTTYSTFTRVEKKDLKVDQDACRAFLDSQGIYEEFSKIDESKVKKIYPTAEFILTGEPTEYLRISKGV